MKRATLVLMVLLTAGVAAAEPPLTADERAALLREWQKVAQGYAGCSQAARAGAISDTQAMQNLAAAQTLRQQASAELSAGMRQLGRAAGAVEARQQLEAEGREGAADAANRMAADALDSARAHRATAGTMRKGAGALEQEAIDARSNREAAGSGAVQTCEAYLKEHHEAFARAANDPGEARVLLARLRESSAAPLRAEAQQITAYVVQTGSALSAGQAAPVERIRAWADQLKKRHIIALRDNEVLELTDAVRKVDVLVSLLTQIERHERAQQTLEGARAAVARTKASASMGSPAARAELRLAAERLRTAQTELGVAEQDKRAAWAAAAQEHIVVAQEQK
ncbi:MAG: hypothetical protein HY527_01085 [Betaproteobacteria bacterium]|nr:hypothetical protein [Betaproteobacteria bacterium]